jgi:hypothetical protein|tara:strand:+ start:10191 stop:10493 length:303 start_codon:yes stop_codon:yes gene_type:complete
MAELIDTMKVKSPLKLEGSWGERDLGEHESTLDLYYNKDDTGFIEWDIPTLDRFEYIGLWFEFDRDGKRSLSEYDGVMSLNDHAIAILRKNGVEVGSDFE